MGPVSAELGIDAEREQAFRFVADLANRPSFTDHFIRDFRLLRTESAGVGAGARFRLIAPPRALWVDTTIEELEAPHRILERGHGGRYNRIGCATEWQLTDGPGPLTTVRVAFRTESTHPLDRAKEILGATSIWQTRDWATALRRLRDLLEPGASEPRRVAVAGA